MRIFDGLFGGQLFSGKAYDPEEALRRRQEEVVREWMRLMEQPDLNACSLKAMQQNLFEKDKEQEKA